jgi:hypothetical protein
VSRNSEHRRGSDKGSVRPGPANIGAKGFLETATSQLRQIRDRAAGAEVTLWIIPTAAPVRIAKRFGLRVELETTSDIFDLSPTLTPPRRFSPCQAKAWPFES